MAARMLLAGSALAATAGALSLEASHDKNGAAHALETTVDAAFQEAAMAGCMSIPLSFDEYMEKYQRTYDPLSAEYQLRSKLFNERQEAVRAHNCEATGWNGPLWTERVNHMSDWTPDELMALRGHKSSRSSNAESITHFPSFLATRGNVWHDMEMPSEFSWANLSTIAAPSEDQGDCGSCWAMASSLAMKARAEIKGIPNKFSAEQLIACTPNPHKCGGTGGCDGATAELAYEYVLQKGLSSPDHFMSLRSKVSNPVEDPKGNCPASLRTESEVTTRGVVAMDGSEVHLVGTSESELRGMIIGMRGWTKLPENKEEPIMRSLMIDGPLYVAVAVGEHWHYYSGGVMTQEGCDPRNVINHAVTLYAWGVKEKTRIGPVKYWAIKNSWGPSWGEKGNVRLHRRDDEEKQCGWDINPQEGNGCEGGPKKVWVCGVCGILYDAVAPHF
jgi:cathepsin L